MSAPVSAAARALRLAAASKRIFGAVPNPTGGRTASSLLQAPLKGEKLLRYYPPLFLEQEAFFRNLRNQGLWKHEGMDWTDRKLAYDRKRGKAPPKKGEGKRKKKGKEDAKKAAAKAAPKKAAA